MDMITTLLIANRGEIAVRIARTARELGIRTVAVHTDADAGAAHVAAADEAVSLGSDPRAYLDVAAVVAAAEATGADAVHPGYGFLSENAGFASACAKAGITFVGPRPEVIAAMGDKISAKRHAVAAGVPVVPGRSEPGLSDDDIVTAVAEVGYPVLLKASAGGGGKGMRVVTGPGELAGAITAARREAAGAFGDDSLMVERYIDSPRHIEVQVLGDSHGNAVHLFDRECSLQRRHQKVVEEAPATSIPQETRERMQADAVALAREVGYEGAGTVEFIVEGNDPTRYYFLEMNTRLQVEHPVTEAITGLDLVAWQLAVAAGEPVADLRPTQRGVAMEARIYAEDPAAGFLPTGGRIAALAWPDGARVDAGVRAGDEVSSHYDPMLAKVITHGADRAEARQRLVGALGGTAILGLTTNTGFLRDVLVTDELARNAIHTRWLDDWSAPGHGLPREGLLAAALDRWLTLTDSGEGVWCALPGWRVGPRAAWVGWRFTQGGQTWDVSVRPGPEGLQVLLANGAGHPDDGELLAVTASRTAPGGVLVTLGGRSQHWRVAHRGDRAWVGRDGRSWELVEQARLSADRADEGETGPGQVRSPMPGTVIDVSVVAGDAVKSGDPLLTVEAMKMEHTLRAAADGVVGELLVAVGDRVALDQDLLRWEAADA